MILKSILEKRFSARSYQSKEVEKEKLDYILECARLSPSACNLQPWKFIVAKSDDAKQKVVESYQRDWFANVYCYIVVCGNHDEAWKRADGKDFTDIDISIAAENICLAVSELGLATCWIGNFKVDILKRNLSLPVHIEPIAIFPIAYPKDDIIIPEKKRKPLDEIVEWR